MSTTPNVQQELRAWKERFKVPMQMEAGGVKFLIDSFLPTGIAFLGGLSSHGKTWLALSMAKALFKGAKFLEYFAVPTGVPIIYLIPESGEAAFKARLDRIGLGSISDGFFCQTMKDGPPIQLDDPFLFEAIRDLKPAIFLDTAIRFSPADNENDARQNDRGLASGVFRMMQEGAQAVVGIHHSPKLFGKAKVPTLENTLRGTGDLGAMADAVYALKCVDVPNFKVRISCVKARDFATLSPFVVQGRPHIDEDGDFKLITEPTQSPDESEMACLATFIKLNPAASYRDLEHATSIPISRIGKVAARAGCGCPTSDDGSWVGYGRPCTSGTTESLDWCLSLQHPRVLAWGMEPEHST
jgi:hypothetical protein